MPPPRRTLPSTKLLLALVAGMVVVPAVLSISVGIVALALWREAFDIVFGVLVLTFAATALAGGTVALLYLRRSSILTRLQAEFVGNVSHELKTPLAGIRLMAETLALGRAEEPAARAEVLAALQSEVSRLEGLVDRLLRWRRLEEQGITLNPAPQAVPDLIALATGRCERVVQAHKARIDVQLAPDLPPILGDRDSLADALGNIVENAVKFGGERGPVEVVCRPDANNVVIEIRDQGPGIPAREVERIFERFYRAPVHLRSRQGTGLGLAIARSVVQAHGGRIEVESEPGIGTAFMVHLPAAAPEPAPAEAPPPAQARRHG